MKNINQELRYASPEEAKAVREIIGRLISDGMYLSYHDGESWELRRCQDASEIFKAMTGVEDIETVRVRNNENQILGNLYFLFQGYPSMDPMEVICDYDVDKDNNYLDIVYNEIHNKLS